MNTQLNGSLQSVLNLSSEGMAYLELSNSEFRFMNDRARHILGHDPERNKKFASEITEFIGLKFSDECKGGKIKTNGGEISFVITPFENGYVVKLEAEQDDAIRIRSFIEEVTSTIPDLISIYDVPSDSIIYTNKNDYWEKLFPNQSRQKKTEKERITETIHPDYYKKVSAFTSERKELKGDASLEIEVRLINDEWIKILSKAFKRNTEGRITQIISITTVITDRKRAEVQIREQANFIKHVTNTMPDIVAVIDVATKKPTYFNRHPTEITGFTADELAAMPPEERLNYLVHPDDRQTLSDYYTALEKNIDDSTVTVKYRFRKKEGGIFWFHVRGKVLTRDANGRALQSLHIGHDATEENKAEEKIKEQLHFINQIALTLPDMLSVIELSTRAMAYANKEPFNLNGFNYDEIIAMSVEERRNLIHPDDQPALDRYFQNFESSSDHDIQQFEYRARMKNGSFEWFRVRGKVFGRDQNGKATHCVNIVQNIHKVKEVELQLALAYRKQKEKETLLKEAEKIGLMGSWEKNLETGQLIWSDELYRIYGLEPQSTEITSGYYVNSFVHPDDRAKTLSHIRSIYEKNTHEAAEYRIITPAGEKVLLSQSNIIRGENEKVIMIRGVVRDITQQKLAEKNFVNLKLNQQKEILNAVLIAQEQERERIGEALHNGVAQQLYGIQIRLQTITGKSEADQGKLKELLSIVSEAINDTRKISFELVPAVLKDYGIEVALQNLFRKIFMNSEDISFQIKGVESRLPEKIEFAIYRIVQELINNIIKHAQASRSKVEIALADNLLDIHVSDNGKGFDDHRLDPMSKGLGLQSIRNRVKLLEGCIKIDSDKNGTTVHIKIPLDS